MTKTATITITVNNNRNEYSINNDELSEAEILGHLQLIETSIKLALLNKNNLQGGK